jgi:hypothetical protein
MTAWLAKGTGDRQGKYRRPSPGGEMRIGQMLVVFTWLSVSGTVGAQDGAAPAKPAVDRRTEAGFSLLSMPFGKGNGQVDLAFAYGMGLSIGHAVFHGLSVGVAPQVLFNIKHAAQAPASTQYDLLARIAYTFRLSARVSIYGEILPGYSIISHPTGDRATGSVIAYGAGGMVDVANRAFLNLAMGYQQGYQRIPLEGIDYWHRDQFWRLVLGVGWRL